MQPNLQVEELQRKATLLSLIVNAAYVVVFLASLGILSLLGHSVKENFETFGTGVRGGIIYGGLMVDGLIGLVLAVIMLYQQTSDSLSRNVVYGINIMLAALAGFLVEFIVHGIFSSTAGWISGAAVFLVLSFVMVMLTSETRLKTQADEGLVLIVQPDLAFAPNFSIEATLLMFFLGFVIGGMILALGVKEIVWETRDLAWVRTLAFSFAIVGGLTIFHWVAWIWAKAMHDNDGIAQIYLSAVIAIVLFGAIWWLLESKLAAAIFGVIILVLLVCSALFAKTLLLRDPNQVDQEQQ